MKASVMSVNPYTRPDSVVRGTVNAAAIALGDDHACEVLRGPVHATYWAMEHGPYLLEYAKRNGHNATALRMWLLGERDGDWAGSKEYAE